MTKANGSTRPSQPGGRGLRRIRTWLPTPVQPIARSVYLRTGPLTSGLRMDPSFMLIGGQRCGTTSLFKYLAEHPQVMRPPVEKGTDYYTLHYSRGNSWYRGHFPLRASAKLQGGRSARAVAFEACTYYMFHPFALERIAQDYPRLKLVVMLRNPVERAFSAYKHEYARGFETEADFERALDLEHTRLRGESKRIRDDIQYESIGHRHHAYMARGQYVDQLERALMSFPREQLYVLDSESFFADPATEFGKLIQFLGLAQYTPRHFSQHNARPSSAMPLGARARLEEHYEPYDRRLEEMLQRPLGWRA